MPILFVHGVNVRSRQDFERSTLPYLRRYIAPVISPQEPESVWIEQVYWGDLGVRFSFDGASRPRSQLLSQGGSPTEIDSPLQRAMIAAQFPQLAAEKLQRPSQQRSNDSLISGSEVGGATGNSVPHPGIADVPPEELADVLMGVLTEAALDADVAVDIPALVDDALADQEVRRMLKRTPPDRQVKLLFDDLRRRLSATQADLPLLAQGGGVIDWLVRAGHRVDEGVRRSAGAPAWAASVVMAELRKPLNDLLSVFIGDVFRYLDQRLDREQITADRPHPPGPIPQCFLEKLQEAHENRQRRKGEPLVVVSHSMGGQIVYDAVTTFLPSDSQLADLRIDFWCAAASQVGFFEESKLFLASRKEYRTRNPVPYPTSHLGTWWNVHDPNDVLSFTARGIIQGVDDEAYSSGMTLLSAHGGYLVRPSFYRLLASKLNAAGPRNWEREPSP